MDLATAATTCVMPTPVRSNLMRLVAFFISILQTAMSDPVTNSTSPSLLSRSLRIDNRQGQEILVAPWVWDEGGLVEFKAEDITQDPVEEFVLFSISTEGKSVQQVSSEIASRVQGLADIEISLERVQVAQDGLQPSIRIRMVQTSSTEFLVVEDPRPLANPGDPARPPVKIGFVEAQEQLTTQTVVGSIATAETIPGGKTVEVTAPRHAQLSILAEVGGFVSFPERPGEANLPPTTSPTAEFETVNSNHFDGSFHIEKPLNRSEEYIPQTFHVLPGSVTDFRAFVTQDTRWFKFRQL